LTNYRQDENGRGRNGGGKRCNISKKLTRLNLPGRIYLFNDEKMDVFSENGKIAGDGRP